MNKKTLLALVVIILALAAGVVYWKTQLTSSDSSGSLVLYGNVDIREVRLAFNGNEHVGEILVEEGDRCEAELPAHQAAGEAESVLTG